MCECVHPASFCMSAGFFIGVLNSGQKLDSNSTCAKALQDLTKLHRKSLGSTTDFIEAYHRKLSLSRQISALNRMLKGY